ncbi:MAG: hypothetical protein MUC47_09450 [Candidatus Kapabacteria bacterium]|nr:hypothetical protein [Candidatus Kapabacteria bacterium]
MFEQEAERVRKKLKQLVATPQPYVALHDILDNTQVHPAYRAYFRAEVDWWIHEERAIRSSNPRFETSHVDCVAALQRVDELYVAHARFDHEELGSTIDAAVKTRLNLLCRPRTTLKWFVYRGEPTRTMQEILLRLGYLYDHRYLVDGIRQWAHGRGADASSYELLSVVEFERIVEKIDNDFILDLSQRDFVALLDPLYDFFAEANPDVPPECVPTEAIIIYLDDKGAIPISQALERLLYREQLTHVTRTKLLAVINDVLDVMDADTGENATVGSVDRIDHSANPLGVGQQDESAASLETSAEPAHAAADVLAAPWTNDVVTLRNEGSALLEDDPSETQPALLGEPLQSSMQDHHAAEVTPVGGEAPEPTDGKGILGEQHDNEAIPAVTDAGRAADDAQTMAHGVSIMEAGPLPDSEEEERKVLGQRRRDRLASMLDDRLREKVIKKVFGKDELLYMRTIEAITASATWKDALGTLDRFYAEHNVEPNSAVAMEFSLAIRQSFVV